MPTVHFTVGRACNNGCRGCLWARGIDLLPEVAVPPSVEVRGQGVRLAGREPTMRRDLNDVIGALSTAGASSVEIETNGRVLSYPSYVRGLRDAGVTRIVVKLFGNSEAVWDAHTRVVGSCAQTLRGIEVCRKVAPAIDLAALVVPRREAGAGARELVEYARQLGFTNVRVELRLAKLDLTALSAVKADLDVLQRRDSTGMRVDVRTI